MTTRTGSHRWPVRIWLRIWNFIVASAIAVCIPERGTAQVGPEGVEAGPQTPHYRWCCAQLRGTLPHGSRVLDLGCGEGYGLRELTRSGFRPVGVDPEGAPLRRSRQGPLIAEVVRGSAEHLPLKNESFDAVVSVEAVEHMQNPLSGLRSARRVLRHGGILLTTTPLAGDEGALHSRFHREEWTRDRFRTLVEASGLIVVQLDEVDFEAETGSRQRTSLLSSWSKIIQRRTGLPAPLPPLETVVGVARAP